MFLSQMCLRIFRWGTVLDYLDEPNVITSPYKSLQEGGRGFRAAVGDVTTEARSGSDRKKGPQTKEYRWLLGAENRKKTDSPLKSEKEHSSANILVSDF